MSTSQNGWPVLPAGSPRLHKFVIPGADRHLILRNGSAGLILAHVALRVHELVERLDLGVWDEWGHAVRAIRGQTTGYSNHASGTAMDLNSTRHGLGTPTLQTWTPKQVEGIHHILSGYDGAVRWGGDYSGRPDSMHFEINVPLAHAELVARELFRTPRGKRLLNSNSGVRAVVLS